MNRDSSSAQAKAFKFTIYAFVFCVLFAAAAGLLARLPGSINSRAAQSLFSSRELKESDESPVVKIPYTVYGRDRESTGKWKFKEGLYDTELITHEGITDKVRKARTCILVWPDLSQSKKSNTYVWSDGNRKVRDAWFCPVYMTVIDREEGIRYKDTRLGEVALSSPYSVKYSGLLYKSRWSTYGVDAWLDNHLEKDPGSN